MINEWEVGAILHAVAKEGQGEDIWGETWIKYTSKSWTMWLSEIRSIPVRKINI